MEGIITFSLLFACIFLTVPVAFGMIGISAIVYSIFADIPLVVIAQNMYFNVKSYAFSSVLYFVFAGNVMTKGEISGSIVNIAKAFVGWIPGGLAIATILGCGLFGAITGSDLATLAAIGGIMVPALEKHGWDRTKAVGIVGAGALLGMIIPPSLTVIVYAIYINISIGELFLAGIGPGIIIIILFSLYLYFTGRKIGGQRFGRPDLMEIVRALKNGVWALGMLIVIFGGIYGGIFTVTEAAAVAAVYALFIELVVFRKLTLRDIPDITLQSALSSASIMFLLAGASVLGRYLTLQQIPELFAQRIFHYVDSSWTFLGVTNVFLLLVGCFLDLISATLILLPVLHPLYLAHNINDYHFGMIFLMNLYCGYLTPPVGVNLFAAAGLFGTSLTATARAYFPFFLILVLVLILVILFPAISLWIPTLVYH